ncbi:hypothetical protein LXL04_003662 [Taraxacum kok-saghyz]
MIQLILEKRNHRRRTFGICFDPFYLKNPSRVDETRKTSQNETSPISFPFVIQLVKQLIFGVGEARSLEKRLGDAAMGNAVRLQMGVVLMFGGQMPLIKVGRTAGQFAMHRSIPFEEKKGVKLPSYRGDNAEGKPKLHSGEDKDVQPTLLITCDQIYFHEIPEDDVDKLIDEGLLLRVARALINEHPLIVPYVKKLPHVIDAEIAVGQHAGKRVFLPRILLSPSDDDMFPFKLRRKQFPVRLCFAMTINKAQGQTIPNVGVYLPEPVFSHGQFYVALSRGISRGNTKVLVKSVEKSNVDEVYTSNVVYKEVLSH